MSTTLHNQLKTNLGMPLQSQALEAPAADSLRVSTKRASACTAMKHCQEERSPSKGSRHPLSKGARSLRTIFVLSKDKTPLMPTSPARARILLKQGRACIHRLAPFTIRLKQPSKMVTQSVIIKIDPGSKTTGIALVRYNNQQHHLLHKSELTHRGNAISKSMQQRAGYRKRRRSANLRYRKPRFNNRKRTPGWLPPSTRSRLIQTINWIKRYQKLIPITEIWIENVKFDTQKLQNPDISGIEYQQGTLQGYEVREYLLQKWNHTCAYCNTQNVPLQIEHIHPKSKGGSDRISNLTIACEKCNIEKGNLPVHEFITNPIKLQKILSQAKTPLRDAAAVNITRHAIFKESKKLGIPAQGFTGGQTKFNRTRLNIPKTHALDAACVGDFSTLHDWQNVPTLQIKATGRGSYQRTLTDKYGFPRAYLMQQKSVHGFRTGDHVKAIVTKGKKQGTYTGRIAVRKSGSFNIQTTTATIQGISFKSCHLLQRSDGYQYNIQRDSTTT